MRIFLKFLSFFWLLVAGPALADFSADKLAAELSARIERVPEFQFIRAEAEKLGVKVYLFGGTAASYGHYVREDLLREAGDKRFPAHRFDYDYTNIFRSTQDLDVVVDGSGQQAEKLEAILKQKFPHFIGDKGAGWEVRPLREARGEKEAILGNPNFLNQHTDSHSTGLVEISKPEPGGIGVRDVRDWESPKPQFLKDVADAKLHYYFNPLHGQTERAAKGLNPPIISVIRYLTKAFQYGLEMRPEDQAKIREIVNAFQPSDINNEYLQRWVEKNGKKLFQHSVDLEYAWNKLEELGLRKKLIAIRYDGAKADTLAWWLQKEPLRSKPVGKGSGKTAAEIAKELKVAKITLAHETNSYLAYESISRDRSGELNALISRADVSGEAARYGEGFYTALGKSGARGTGLTVRMELDPAAREGTDFIRAADKFYVIRNKAAVRVIPEQLQISLLEYFRNLANGAIFSKDDRALLETFKRKAGRAALVNEAEEKKIFAIVKKIAQNPKAPEPIIREWFSLPMSAKYPEIVDSLWRSSENYSLITKYVLSQPHWGHREDWLERMVTKHSDAQDLFLAEHVFSKPHWGKRLDLMKEFVNSGKAGYLLAKFAISQPHWAEHPELVEAMLKAGHNNGALAMFALNQPHWRKHPQFVEALAADPKHASTVLNYVLSLPEWADRGDLIEKIADKNPQGMIQHILTKPYWQNRPDWVEAILAGGQHDNDLARHVLSKAHWQNHPEWIETLLKRESADVAILQSVLSQPHWKHRSDWVDILVNKKYVDKEIAKYLLSHPQWQDRADILRTLLDRGQADTEIVDLLKTPIWKDHPEFIEALVRRPQKIKNISTDLLDLPHWKAHPQLRAAVGPGKEVNYKNLLAAFEAGFTFQPLAPHPLELVGGCPELFRSL